MSLAYNQNVDAWGQPEYIYVSTPGHGDGITEQRNPAYSAQGPGRQAPGAIAGSWLSETASGFMSGGVGGALSALGGAVAGAFGGPKVPATLPAGGGGQLPPLPPGAGSILGGGINMGGLGGTLGGIGGILPRIGGVLGGAAAGGAVVGTAGARVGKIVRAVGGYYIFDKVMGWIFKTGNPPKKRMNVLNPRALSRADRRIQGFACKVRPIMRTLGYQVGTTRKAQGCKKGKCRK